MDYRTRWSVWNCQCVFHLSVSTPLPNAKLVYLDVEIRSCLPLIRCWLPAVAAAAGGLRGPIDITVQGARSRLPATRGTLTWDFRSRQLQEGSRFQRIATRSRLFPRTEHTLYGRAFRPDYSVYCTQEVLGRLGPVRMGTPMIKHSEVLPPC